MTDAVALDKEKAIESRKRWKKFGVCNGVRRDKLESGITWASEEDVFIEWVREIENENEGHDAMKEEEELKREAARQVEAQLRVQRFQKRITELKPRLVTQQPYTSQSQMPTGNGRYIPPARRYTCLLYTSPSPRDQRGSRMPSSA